MLSNYLNKLEELIQQRDFLTFGLLAVGILMGMLFIRFLFNRVLSYFDLNKQPENNQPTIATHPEVEECFDDSIKIPENVKEDLNEPNNLQDIEINNNSIVVMEEIDNTNIVNSSELSHYLDNDDNNEPKIQEILDDELEAVEQSLPEAVEQQLPKEVKQLLPEEAEQSLPEAVEQQLPEAVEQQLPEAVEQQLSANQDELGLDLDLEEVTLDYN